MPKPSEPVVTTKKKIICILTQKSVTEKEFGNSCQVMNLQKPVEKSSVKNIPMFPLASQSSNLDRGSAQQWAHWLVTPDQIQEATLQPQHCTISPGQETLDHNLSPTCNTFPKRVNALTRKIFNTGYSSLSKLDMDW